MLYLKKNLMRFKHHICIFIGLSMFFAVSCERVTRLPKAIQSLSVAPSSSTIEVGDTRQFYATVIYTDGSREKVTVQATWRSLNASVASINSDHGSLSGSAHGLAVGTTSITAEYRGVTSAPVILSVIEINTKKYFAYITNFDINTVSYCRIQSTGGLTDCASVGSGFGFNNPFGITINPNGKYAYIVNSGTSGLNAQTISICAINSTTGAFDGCTQTPQQPGAFEHIISITFDDISNNLYVLNAYPIAYRQGFRWQLTPDGSSVTSEFAGILDTSAFGTIYFQSLVMNPSGTQFYVSEDVDQFAPQILRCPATGCVSPYTFDTVGVSTITGMAIIDETKNNYAYLLNPNIGFSGPALNTIRYCSIKSTNNALYNCLQAVPQIAGWVPYAIAVNLKNLNFYVTDVSNNNRVFYCNASANPQAPTCTPAANGFSQPYGIAVTP